MFDSHRHNRFCFSCVILFENRDQVIQMVKVKSKEKSITNQFVTKNLVTFQKDFVTKIFGKKN